MAFRYGKQVCISHLLCAVRSLHPSLCGRGKRFQIDMERIVRHRRKNSLRFRGRLPAGHNRCHTGDADESELRDRTCGPAVTACRHSPRGSRVEQVIRPSQRQKHIYVSRRRLDKSFFFYKPVDAFWRQNWGIRWHIKYREPTVPLLDWSRGLQSSACKPGDHFSQAFTRRLREL